MVENGHDMSPGQCEGRWKTLMRGLKLVHDHNSKSGNNAKQYPYENELAFMAVKPNISASYVVSSACSSKPATSSSANQPSLLQDEESDSKDNLLAKESDTDSEKIAASENKTKKAQIDEPKPKRKRPNEVVDVLKGFISTQQERFDAESNRREQMHKERMEIFKGFLSILQNKVNDKMSGWQLC